MLGSMYNEMKTFVWPLSSGCLALQASVVHVLCVHMRTQAPT